MKTKLEKIRNQRHILKKNKKHQTKQTLHYKTVIDNKVHHYVKTPQCAKHQMHTPQNRYDSSNKIEAKGNSNTQYTKLYQKEEEIRKTKRDRNQTRKRFKRVEIESTV